MKTLRQPSHPDLLTQRPLRRFSQTVSLRQIERTSFGLNGFLTRQPNVSLACGLTLKVLSFAQPLNVRLFVCSFAGRVVCHHRPSRGPSRTSGSEDSVRLLLSLLVLLLLLLLFREYHL